MDLLRRDATYAIRVLARRRGFAAITFVTRIVTVGPPSQVGSGGVSAPDFIDWRRSSRTLDA